jgi:hypothetical protein
MWLLLSNFTLHTSDLTPSASHANHASIPDASRSSPPPLGRGARAPGAGVPDHAAPGPARGLASGAARHPLSQRPGAARARRHPRRSLVRRRRRRAAGSVQRRCRRGHLSLCAQPGFPARRGGRPAALRQLRHDRAGADLEPVATAAEERRQHLGDRARRTGCSRSGRAAARMRWTWPRWRPSARPTSMAPAAGWVRGEPSRPTRSRTRTPARSTTSASRSRGPMRG